MSHLSNPNITIIPLSYTVVMNVGRFIQNIFISIHLNIKIHYQCREYRTLGKRLLNAQFNYVWGFDDVLLHQR